MNLGCAYGVRFSPDGTRLAVLGHDLILWDVAARQKLWRGKPVPHCSAMAFSPDGSRLAVKSTTGLMAVVDAATGDVIVNFRNKKDGEGSGPAWSPCGQYVADGGWNGRLQVREAATGEVVFAQDHPGEMLRGAYAPSMVPSACWSCMASNRSKKGRRSRPITSPCGTGRCRPARDAPCCRCPA